MVRFRSQDRRSHTSLGPNLTTCRGMIETIPYESSFERPFIVPSPQDFSYAPGKQQQLFQNKLNKIRMKELGSGTWTRFETLLLGSDPLPVHL